LLAVRRAKWEYPLLLAKDLQFLTADEFDDLEGKVLEVQRMLPLSSNLCRVRF